MAKKYGGIRGFNILMSSTLVFLSIISIISLYFFILFKESLYALGFIGLLFVFAGIFIINIQISKFIPLNDIIENKIKRKDIIEEELKALFKEEKIEKEIKCGRKSKRYIAQKNSFIIVKYSFNRKEYQENVGMIDISRNGIKITSNHIIKNSLKVELSPNYAVEADIVREGVIENENLYFYGLKFKNNINSKKIEEITKKCA
jgi:hypothetical protein